MAEFIARLTDIIASLAAHGMVAMLIAAITFLLSLGMVLLFVWHAAKLVKSITVWVWARPLTVKIRLDKDSRRERSIENNPRPFDNVINSYVIEEPNDSGSLTAGARADEWPMLDARRSSALDVRLKPK
jgi:hypothetical protein